MERKFNDDSNQTHETHIGFTNFVHHLTLASTDGETDGQILNQLLDAIDSTPFGQIVIYGRTYDDNTSQFIFSPPDVDRNPPLILKLSRQVSKIFISWDGFDAIQFGTQCKRTQPMTGSSKGILITWDRTDHRHCVQAVAAV